MAKPIRVQIRAIRDEFEHVPEGLLRHVERVLEEAVALAGHWDLDPERVSLAVWGHDLFRAHKPGDQLRLAHEAGIDVAPDEEKYPVLLHGPIAGAVLRARFGVTDEDALAAVSSHTSGLPAMPLIAKVLLIADKVEARKRKRTPVMAEVRRLARRDLDTALLCWADWKWIDERRSGWESSSAHWLARGAWVREHHLDAGLPGRGPDIDEDSTVAEAIVPDPCPSNP